MNVSSPHFVADGWLDDKYAASGANLAPVLVVSGVPREAVELALVMHDPDAPSPHGFTHWLRYGLPPTDGPLGVRGATRDGTNDYGENTYGGPMPPVGHGTHHYYFTVYALRTRVHGEPSRLDFLAHYQGEILTQNRLVGLYARQSDAVPDP